MHLPAALRRDPRPPAAVELLTVVAAGAVATQVKTWAEAVLQPLGERLFPPSDAEEQRAGADPGGHPAQMPPQLLVAEVGEDVEGHSLSDEVRGEISEGVHWAMGIGGAVAYGLLAHRFPVARAGRGTAFGAVLWAATHGSLLPAIGIQAPLGDLPRAWWVWEGGSHLVYGAATDLALTLGDDLAARLHSR